MKRFLERKQSNSKYLEKNNNKHLILYTKRIIILIK